MNSGGPSPTNRATGDRTADFEKVPPQDLAAEQSVLGSMLLSKDAIADVVAMLKPADYYRPAHELIHSVILDLFTAGEPADPITVADELTKRGELVRAGGASYLHTLVTTVPTAANAEYYAQIVHERAVLRRLVGAGTAIASMGYAAEGEVDEVVAAAQAELAKVDDVRAEEEILKVEDTIGATFALMENIASRDKDVHGVPTGFADLDALTNGLQPGQFVIIAARPAIGKSTLALDMARHAAIRAGVPTTLFSLEMTRDELTMRMLSAEARVGLHLMRNGHLTDADWDRLAAVTPSINAAPLFIDDSPNLSAVQIRAKARRQQQRHGLGLVVIDYLQLMQNGGRRAENRQQEVSEISRNMKLLAKELNVPVVALSQLNRGPEQRTDKTPMASDLRESGSLEQDADVVILLHREDAYDKESPRAGEADMIVAKHRNGPTATITVAFQGHYSRFVDMAKDV
ncbi:replicative DNA helicase [Kitasatospora cathayae]|uniref:Replicative DNA helicase n=1 Tax=Kitasatospora cathayae TaxID=3004092 RepID=A0ABY7QHB1_9ACTN|nr:replicative DNA helicase [Kitasatospora sp. HUAS 3-15]WBP92180.1 replicative DNA helicase [Kitasatospora sp. HUAS 3-15]